MNFGKKWKLAGTIIRETRFRSQLSSNPSFRSRAKENPERIMKNAKRGNIISMVFTTFLVIILAAVSLALIIFGDPAQSPIISLAVSFGSFLLLSFVLIFFLNLLGTSGFFMSGVASFPAMLPISRGDLEDIVFFAFMRTFAGPSIAILTVFPIGLLILIGPVACLAAFSSCLITVLASFTALILVAKWYHKKSLEQPGSTVSTIVRVLAGVMLMVGFIAVYSVGNYLPVLVGILTNLSQQYGIAINILLSVVFPFNVGLLTGIATYGLLVTPEIIVLSIASAILYSFLAVRGYRIARKELRKTVLGGIETKVTYEAVGRPLDISSPTLAIIRKDIRLATRDLGSLAILIFPLIMLVAWIPTFAQVAGGVVSITTILTLMIMVQSFSGISMTGLLGVDTQGASVYDGLPLSTITNLKAKATLFTVTYVFFMAVVSFLFVVGTPFSPFAIFIPIIQIPLGYGLALVVGGVLFRVVGGGRTVAVNPVNNQKATVIALFIALVVGTIPLLGLALGLFLTNGILVGLGFQGVLVAVEILLARTMVPRMLIN
ncbi:hypothetical protein EU537_05105 [Candidatus Thorarchaeota archaeon]|nr:MAG: hypothetical protein EU537_05105 [Candidatus Thorarchaeota archaeon]